MAVVYEALAEGFRPTTRLTVSEWADRYRFLAKKSSNESGPWRTSRTPYLREIMDSLSVDCPINIVAVAKGSQLGMSEAGYNWLGYTMDHEPRSMLWLAPTDDKVRQSVRNRIDPMIDACPSIREKIGAGVKGGDALSYKEVPGASFYFRGAASPSSVAEITVGNIAIDEPDRFPRDVGGEGSPLFLAQRRAATFGDQRKEYYCSTPTVEGQSRIWEMYEAGDQRRYFVPCPHCGHMQTIEWDRIKWASPKDDPYLACEENGCVIEERHKTQLLERGEWRPTAHCDNPRYRSYHLSSLYSPLGWYSWRGARDDFLKAHKLLKEDKDPTDLKAFVNTVLGQCWAEKGESPPWEALYARRETYARNTVPAGGLVLTAAADVQKDRIEVEVRAWGPRLESWSIDHRVFAGDPSRLDGDRSPWPHVDAMLSESWPHELGGRIGLTCMAVDTGDQTQAVYSWCRKHSPTRVMAVKGDKDHGSASALLSTPKRVDVREDGKLIPHGVTLWMVGSSIAKSELYGWLRQPRPEPGEQVPTGWMHWPEYDEEYFKQLTAEQIIVKVVRGFRRPLWEKTRLRNEALDLHVYNRAAAAQIGVDRWEPRRWEQLRAQLTVSKPDAKGEVVTGRPKVKPRKSTYW